MLNFFIKGFVLIKSIAPKFAFKKKKKFKISFE